MKRNPGVMPAVRTDAFSLGGGISKNKSALQAKPGTLVDCLNYEPYVSGGYERCQGYERFDGQARPSAQDYTAVACTLNVGHGLTTGTALTIGAITCVFIAEVTGGMLVTKVSGTVPTNTSIDIAGPTSKGTTDATDTALDYGPTNLERATYLDLVYDEYRNDIAAVPGEGDILGVWMFNDVVYAFRNDVGGAAASMWKSSAAGWVEVDLGYQLKFQTGTAEVSVGQTLTGFSSGASGVVKRIELHTGTWAGGTATGIIIFDTITSGPFTTGESLQVGGATKCVANGGSSAITLPADGKYRFCNANFGAQVTSYRMFGCNGVGNGFEFDGTDFVPIFTGAATDTPTAVIEHAQHLMWALGGSVIHSELGYPHRYDASLTAGEIGTGDTITNFTKVTGALLITSLNSIRALLGSSSADWSLSVVAAEMGGNQYTAQSLGNTTAVVDDRGLIEVAPGQNYGNFDSATVSRHVQTLFNAYVGQYVDACLVRAKNQYRVFTNDGTVLVMRIEPGQAREFGLLRYDDIPTCVCSLEDSSGQERIFFGDSTGMVYEAERGPSFDGDNIFAAMVTWPTNARAPTLHKTYRHAWIEAETDLYSSIEISPQFDYEAGDTQPALTSESDFTYEARGAGGRWESAYFESFFWDSPYVEKFKLDISGSGTVIAFVIVADSKIDAGHRIRAIEYTYSTRRQNR